MQEVGYKIDVPAKFCFADTLLYPENNFPDMEWYLYQTYRGGEEIERIYLPIMWTAYLKFHNYGKNNRAIRELQEYVNTLDKSLKYWTAVQFDDGTMIDWTGIDIIIFGSGCKGDYQLSLTCQPHKFDFSAIKKDILCSFVGRITHPIREEIMKLKNEEGFYVTDVHHNQYEYHKIMARSEFVIGSRGYGKSCFKIAEAMQNGAIPIYVSDEFLFPHNYGFKAYGMYMTANNIDKELPSFVNKMPLHEKERMQKLIPGIYKKIYTFEGNMNYILNILKNEVDGLS